MRPLRLLLTAGLWVAAGPGAASGGAQSAQPVPLDVPYLPQSVLLCGGAALAMVERWWGQRGVYAYDFAELVRPSEGGIRTDDLAAAARARGWDTQVWPGTPELVRQALRDSVPVVALIQVGRDRYHYVVVLAWADGIVVFHDPARAPHVTLDESRFLERWSGADRWAMALRPAELSAADGPTGDVLSSPAGPVSPPPLEALPCPPWIDLALAAVVARRLDEAEALLAEAGRVCPAEPRVLRELAGVHFLQGQYAAALPVVNEYLAERPEDPLAWQILASSRYLSGDRVGALEAWNRLGRPTVDLVRIEGIRSIRYGELARAASVSHGAVLTPDQFALAGRRVGSIPALRRGVVEYQPVANGLVELRVMVDERPRFGPAWRVMAGEVVRGVTRQEVGLEVASPTGAGELWSGTWRWEFARPRLAFRVDLPAGLGFPGVVGAETAWDQFRFALDTGSGAIVESSRRATGIAFGGWAMTSVRPSVAFRLERWSGDRSHLVMAGGVEVRASSDRLALRVGAERAVALTPHEAYGRGSAFAMWTSFPGLTRRGWSARFGFDWASRQAPLGVWPVTGTNLTWGIPLRADSRSSDGLPFGGSAGQAILHAGVSGDHPVHRLGPLLLAVGAFLDGARVTRAADGTPGNQLHLDGGAGIRLGLADGHLGILRLDLARGLLESRRSAVTIGFHATWPPLAREARWGDGP